MARGPMRMYTELSILMVASVGRTPRVKYPLLQMVGPSACLVPSLMLLSKKRAEQALKNERQNLHETNTALRVLLKQREEDKKELEQRFLLNVKQLVLPHLDRLKKTRLEGEQKTSVDLMDGARKKS